VKKKSNFFWKSIKIHLLELLSERKMPLSSIMRQKLSKFGKFAKSMVKGTYQNWKKGSERMMDPNVPGSLTHYAGRVMDWAEYNKSKKK